jgi:hypothetical protein
MAEIAVMRTGDGEPMGFDVTIVENGSSTEHRVTLSRSDLERLGSGRSPEDLVRACFGFLLEREPKESILESFDIGVIGRYFPEFERTIVES